MDQLYHEIELAEKRIRQYLSPTPLIYSEFLTKAVNATLSSDKKPIKVYLKLESENLTGSFKVRGAYNKLDVNRTQGTIQTKQIWTKKNKNNSKYISCDIIRFMNNI
jgi:threonine dehydratase